MGPGHGPGSSSPIDGPSGRLRPHGPWALANPGGLQEEVTVPSIGKSIIVLRTSTERPEAVEAGHAGVMGFEKEAIWKEMEARDKGGRP